MKKFAIKAILLAFIILGIFAISCHNEEESVEIQKIKFKESSRDAGAYLTQIEFCVKINKNGIGL